jgi:NADH-quinone oxidoreductase subunit H
LLFATVWVRASLPRMRYDRLMALGWKVLIEAAVLWVLLVSWVYVAKDQGWPAYSILIVIAVGLGAYGVLWLAIPKPGESVEEIR